MPLYTIDEAAEYTGLSTSTIYRLMRAGEIRFFQASKRKGSPLRFQLDWLDDFIKANSKPLGTNQSKPKAVTEAVVRSGR